MKTPRDYTTIWDGHAKRFNSTALTPPETNTNFKYLKLYADLDPEQELYGTIFGLLETPNDEIINFEFCIYSPGFYTANNIINFEKIKIESFAGIEMFEKEYANQGCAFAKDIPDKLLNDFELEVRTWHKEMKEFSKTQFFEYVKKNTNRHKKYVKQLDKERNRDEAR